MAMHWPRRVAARRGLLSLGDAYKRTEHSQHSQGVGYVSLGYYVPMTLDPDDTRPPYAQVVDALRQEIEQGTLQPGAKLPTHQELVSTYGVSVGTIKRALGELQG